MRSFISAFGLLMLVLLHACTSENSKPTNPIEAGRYFIDASLKGNYQDAKKYMLPDSVNLQMLDRIGEFYNKMKPDEKEGYKNANIIISNDGIENVSDSVTIINYSNTFKNKPAKIKVVRINGSWLVDFKYTFSGNL